MPGFPWANPGLGGERFLQPGVSDIGVLGPTTGVFLDLHQFWVHHTLRPFCKASKVGEYFGHFAFACALAFRAAAQLKGIDFFALRPEWGMINGTSAGNVVATRFAAYLR